MNCPRCGSPNSVTNGPIHSGNQNFKCRDCHRHFVQNPRHQLISEGTKEVIGFSKKKYLEPGLPKLRGCPPAGCNTMCFSTISIRPPASSSKVKKKGKLTSQSDEMWSFVGYKGNKQWKELAIDALTKEILGL